MALGWLWWRFVPVWRHRHLSHTTLSHTILPTTLSHAMFATQYFTQQLCHTICHTPSLTHILVTHNFFTHHLSHNFVTHTHATLSCTIFHTGICVTHNSSYTTVERIDPPPPPLSIFPSLFHLNSCFCLLEEVDLWGCPVLEFVNHPAIGVPQL